MCNGYQCSYGKVEMLKGDFSGYASVRIDKKNRICYFIFVDDYLIQEFILFSKGTSPPEYYGEKFFNPWFFDEENRLVCHEGKFTEINAFFSFSGN